jgi:hypothetical protein
MHKITKTAIRNEKLVYEKTKKLIVDSANKYKDYALFY